MIKHEFSTLLPLQKIIRSDTNASYPYLQQFLNSHKEDAIMEVDGEELDETDSDSVISEGPKSKMSYDVLPAEDTNSRESQSDDNSDDSLPHKSKYSYYAHCWYNEGKLIIRQF